MDSATKEIDRLGIRVANQGWTDADYRSYPESSERSYSGSKVITEPKTSSRMIAFGVLFLGFFIFLSLVSSEGTTSLTLLRGFIMVVASLMIWSRRSPLVVIGSITAVLFVSGAIASIDGGTETGKFGLITMLATSLFIGWVGSPLWQKQQVVLTPGRYIYGYQPTEWGRGAGDSTPSSIWIMGLLLNKLIRIPGVFVFHGLKSPGTKFIDVEHAVVHGNNVYLIDSWHGYPSEYNWHLNKRGTVISSSGDDGHRHTKMANAADRYRKILGHDVNVVPIIAIVTGKPIVGPDRWSPRGVGLFNADELLDYTGTGASKSLPTWQDRPDVREKIVATVV